MCGCFEERCEVGRWTIYPLMERTKTVTNHTSHEGVVLTSVEGNHLGNVARVCQAAQGGSGHLPLLVLLVEDTHHVRVLHRARLDDVDRDASRA